MTLIINDIDLLEKMLRDRGHRLRTRKVLRRPRVVKRGQLLLKGPERQDAEELGDNIHCCQQDMSEHELLWTDVAYQRNLPAR